MRKERGITLIALIITIIVMLILVGVSVSILINSNLIGAAEKAGDAYSNEIATEEKYNPTIGNWKILDDYMKDAKIVEEVHDWKIDGDKFTCTCDLCKAHKNGKPSNGLTVTIGQEIKYQAERKTKTGGTIATTKITAAQSGHTEDQTISLTEEPTYVIMGVADINENGTNETLLLTTLKPTTEKIELKGAAAYNNGPEQINRMCRELYGKDARSMTIEDVNNCLGYTNPKGMYYNTTGNTRTVNNLTTKLKDLPEEIWNAIKDSHHTPDGKNTEVTLGEYQLNGYGYAISSTEATDARKNLILASNYPYWLASCGVGVHAAKGYAGFGPGIVKNGLAYSYGHSYTSDGTDYHLELRLRPLVSLTSEIPEVVATETAS